MNMQVLDTRRDASGGYKVDVSRGSHNGRVASEWFSRPDDQRYLSLDDLARSVRGRSERSRTRIIESALIHVEANHRSRAGETFTFAYDNLGRVTSKEVPTRSGLSTTHTRDVYYGYDLFGALTYARFDSTAGEGLNLTYNALGQLTSSTQSLDGITRTLGYQYDAAGRRTRITFPDAAYWQYQYDKLGRFTNLKDQLNRDLVLDAYYNFGIRYSHKREGSAPDDTYYLDFAKRLTRTFTDHPTAGYDVNQEWAYNPANQAVTESLDNQLFVWTGHPLNTSEVAYTSNGLNQIASGNSNAFTYDANGNLTFDGLTSFTYDTENRLVTASGQNNVALRYDPFGRLYEIDDGQGGVRRLLYDGDALVAEYNTAGTMLDRYIHGVGAGDDPLLRYPGSSTSYLDAEYMVTDRLGSVIARYKRDGTAVAINSYDEYGVPGPVSGIENNGRFRYTGQIWLPELGQYYYKARMYSPTLGRFMQTDPIGYADGMNIYRYVGNDPVNAVDPSGMTSTCVSWPEKVGTSTYVPPDPNDPDGEGVFIVTTSLVVREVCFDSETGHSEFTSGVIAGGGPSAPKPPDTKLCRRLRKKAEDGRKAVPKWAALPKIWNDSAALKFYLFTVRDGISDGKRAPLVVGAAASVMRATVGPPAAASAGGGATTGAKLFLDEKVSFDQAVAATLEARLEYLQAVEDGSCPAG